jgi:hypothetical protein
VGKKFDAGALLDNALATWGLTVMAVVGMLQGLWVIGGICAVVTGCAWTVSLRRARASKQEN